MEMLERIYRILILISAVMNFVWMFFREFYWPYFSHDMQKILGVDGYGSVIPWSGYLFVVILSINILCYVGLLLFKKWAVWTLLGLYILVLVILAPFAGVEVAAPVERIAKSFLLMADGAIISLVFLTDLKLKFHSSKSSGCQGSSRLNFLLDFLRRLLQKIRSL